MTNSDRAAKMHLMLHVKSFKRQNALTEWRFWHITTGSVGHRSSQSEAVVYIENGLAQNHQILHGHPYWSTTTPDMTSLLPVRSYRRSKMPPPWASGVISRERFKRGSHNFTCLSWTTGLPNVPDMTSLAISGRLQNAIKYCRKMHKRVRPT